MNIRSLVTGICCGLAIGAFAIETVPLVIPEIKTPPKMDGALDDPTWQNAAKIEQLYLFKTNTPAKDTTVYLVRDKKWLYLGFKCVNSNMAHVIQTVFKHDDLYPNFYANESVEVYIKPEEASDRYYWFVLSSANVTFEQRIQTTPIRKQDVGWNTPWRSATKLLPDGWTAEIAIPLFALECDDLGSAQINIARNLRAIELDPYGAKQGEKTVFCTLKPYTMDRGKSHDFKNFAAGGGLGGFKPEVPFAPRIDTAVVTGLRQKDGKYFYDVKMTLETASSVAGKAKVRVIEDTGTGDVEKLSELVDLDGKRELVLSVPTGDLRERKVRVALVDPADGNLLAAMAIEDLSALRAIKKAFVGRSYYTAEANADIRLELGLPETMLKEALLVIDVNGVKALEIKGLKPAMTAEIPLSALKPGDNTLVVRLVSAGTELAAKNLGVQRLAPRPGFEVKTDFIKGVMLKDDQPIFPVGMYVSDWSSELIFPAGGVKEGEEGMFKFLSDIGFTTLINEHVRRLTKEQTDPLACAQADMFAKLADKYGMNVIEWFVPPGVKTEGSTLAEWLATAKESYKKLEPVLIEHAKIMREHRNMLCYYNVDEPNLGGDRRDVKIAAAEWYWNTVQATDPYRPQFLLYSMNIPHGDNWTRWGEILGFDIYPRPFMDRGIYSEPGLYTACYAYALRERCRQDNKVMFFVPLSNILDLGRTLIGMSKAHMLCQAYTAVIYGSRGLMYFVLQVVVGEDAWDALKTINAQIKEMTPALVNGDIAQNIRYTPDNFNPAEQKFPMVNAAVFQYPDGDYLLMAVNIVPFAVDTKFKVGGMKNAVRLFDKTDKKFAGEFFTDKIEGYGVRAYKIKLADNPAPVQVALDMTALKDEKAPGVDVQGIIRKVRRGKNHMPNPCFKQQFNKGVPDFYIPAFYGRLDLDGGKQGSSTWCLDAKTPWNGIPSLRLVCTEKSSEPRQWMTGIYYPPATDKPQKMVFSFYAKGAKDGNSVKIGKHFPLTTEWKRYQFTSDLPPGNDERSSKFYIVPAPMGATIWISGLQVEEGETATEFQDDAVSER